MLGEGVCRGTGETSSGRRFLYAPNSRCGVGALGLTALAMDWALRAGRRLPDDHVGPIYRRPVDDANPRY